MRLLLINCLNLLRNKIISMKNNSKALTSSEKVNLQKLQDIVANTIEQEKLITENLLHPPEEVLTKGQKISDKVASFGGSWAFIFSFLSFW